MKKQNRTRPSAGRNNPPIKALLVGAHPLILEALKLCFCAETRFRVVGLLNCARLPTPPECGETPDVILFDAAIDSDNAATTRRLTSTYPGAGVIVLAASANPQAISGLLRDGVRGCVGKDCSSAELLKAAETVSRGELYFSPAISTLMQHEFIRQANQRDRAGVNALKPTERSLLEMIAAGSSNKEMADRLNMSVRTIEKYRESLMAKLGIRSVAGLTKFAIRHGLSSLE